MGSGVGQRGSHAGMALGADPASTLAALAERVLKLIDGSDGTELVTMFAGGMRLSDYLPTRTFELAVHTADLAVALTYRQQLPPRHFTLLPSPRRHRPCRPAAARGDRAPGAPAGLIGALNRATIPAALRERCGRLERPGRRSATACVPHDSPLLGSIGNSGYLLPGRDGVPVMLPCSSPYRAITQTSGLWTRRHDNPSLTTGWPGVGATAWGRRTLSEHAARCLGVDRVRRLRVCRGSPVVQVSPIPSSVRCCGPNW